MDTDVLEQRTAIDYHDCSHWWLVDTTTDKVYDITADQYYHVGQTPPYPGKKKIMVWLEAKTAPEDTRSDGFGSWRQIGSLDETVTHSV